MVFKSLEPIICAFAAQAAVCINNALLIETNSHLIELLNDTNQRLEKENRFLKARNSRNPDYNIIGQSEAMQRVKAGFMAIHEAHPGQVVAIVTHGGVLATVFAWVLGIPEGVRPRCKVLNASINTVAIHQDSAQIVSWGDVAHL